MDTQKVLSVVEMYRIRLQEEGVPKAKMDVSRTFKSLSSQECLAHAHHLLDGIVEYAKHPEMENKMHRHFAAVQAMLGFAGWYTLQELMDHNRPT